MEHSDPGFFAAVCLLFGLTTVESPNKTALLDLAHDVAANKTIVVGRSRAGVFVFYLIEHGLHFLGGRRRHQAKISLREKLIRLV